MGTTMINGRVCVDGDGERRRRTRRMRQGTPLHILASPPLSTILNHSYLATILSLRRMHVFPFIQKIPVSTFPVFV